jgi:phosphatidylserine/phosphatidylglycerophosphate/cardiolipin synthase-like enzyme
VDCATRAALAASGAEHFSPWEDLDQLDIAELRNARQRVDVAMYSFTDRRLADVLNELAARQVEVRVYRDQEQFQHEERAAARFREPSTTHYSAALRMIHSCACQTRVLRRFNARESILQSTAACFGKGSAN